MKMIKEMLRSLYHAMPFWFWAVMTWVLVFGLFFIAVELALYIVGDEEPEEEKPSPKAREKPKERVWPAHSIFSTLENQTGLNESLMKPQRHHMVTTKRPRC